MPGISRTLLCWLLILSMLSGCVVPLSPAAMPAPAMPAEPPRELTVLVGAGQDTAQIFAFFPATLRIRAGDTVTWELNSDEPHTVSFMGEGATFTENAIPDPGGKSTKLIPGLVVPVPGGEPNETMFNPQIAFPSQPPGAPTPTYAGSGYLNSGVMSFEPQGPDAPPNDHFSVTFDTPGVYEFVSLLAPDRMRGWIEVVEASATDLPSQDEIDAQVQAEIDAFLGIIEMANQQGEFVRSEPGPNGTTLWYIRAGSTDFISGDSRAQSFEFLPKDLTIQAGDTIIWSANFFHTITFLPAPPPPEPLIPQPQEAGPPLLLINPQVFAPSKPSPFYDPAQYFNSGALGPLGPIGGAWALTFDESGTYDYFCIVHRELGMEGRIIVEERAQ